MNNNATITINSKITSKNQVTIPKTIREVLNINSSDEISFSVNPNNHQVTITAHKPDFWSVVHKQEQKYGNLSTPEVDWGNDIESEDF